MKERKALRLALEALEEVKSWKSSTRWDGCFDKEISAIKEALTQPYHYLVGLTEEERDNMINQAYDDFNDLKILDTDLEIAKNIEAKLMEKNG